MVLGRAKWCQAGLSGVVKASMLVLVLCRYCPKQQPQGLKRRFSGAFITPEPVLQNGASVIYGSKRV